MKQVKRIVALLLVVCFAFAAFGCAKTETTEAAKSTTASSTKADETTKAADATTAEATTEDKYAEAITLTVVSSFGGRTWVPEEVKSCQVLLQNIKDMFNVDLEVEVIDSDADLAQRFAAGMDADIIDMGAFDSFDYKDSLLNLADLWKNYENIYENTAQSSVDFLMQGDELYALPHENNYVKYFTQIRKDWLVNLGYDVEKWELLNDDTDVRVMSMEDFEEILYKFTKEDPDQNGKDDTYGLGYYTAADVEASFMMFYGCFGGALGQYYVNGNTMYAYETSDNYRAALEEISKLWAQGLIDPEIYTLTKETGKEKIMQGKVGCYNSWWSTAYEMIRDGMREIEGQEDVDWLTVCIDNNGVGGMKNNGAITSSVGINAECEDPERALEVLNYLASEEAWLLIRYGIAGEDYIADADGFVQERTESGQATFTANKLDGLYKIVNRIDLENKANSVPPTDELMLIRYGMLLHQFLTDAPLYQTVTYGMPVPEEYTTFGADVKNIRDQYNMKFITGQLELNDTTWAEYLDKWASAGGTDILDAYVEEVNDVKGTNYVAGLK